MKKGVELRKIVTIIDWSTLEGLLSKQEQDTFISIYCPGNDCYIQFEFAPFGYDTPLKELENVLEKILEIPRSEIILIKFDY